MLRLAEVLKRKRLTKRQFAEMLGIRYHNVFRMFHKGYNPRLSQLALWARLLNCRIRDLITDVK